jgi:hypothetical protein
LYYLALEVIWQKTKIKKLERSKSLSRYNHQVSIGKNIIHKGIQV